MGLRRNERQTSLRQDEAAASPTHAVPTVSAAPASGQSAGAPDQRQDRSIAVAADLMIERILSLEIARLTESAAVSPARLRGLGNEIEADRAAVDAMRRELAKLPITGTVVIGEGERDEAPMLFIGEEVGTGMGPGFDVAVDPLEGTTLCAKNLPGAVTVIAIAEQGTLLHAPDVYMEKIAVGPGFPEGIVDLDAPVEENIAAVARAKGVDCSAVNVLVLERPRHAELIAAARKAGAAVSLITDRDIAGVIHTADPDNTGIDIYMGIGGAPEGLLTAAALRCIGGQMQARLVLDRPEARTRAAGMGILEPRKKYQIDDMVSGDCLFAATGVTDGSLLRGVRFRKHAIETETLVMRSSTGTLRRVRAEHHLREKFRLA